MMVWSLTWSQTSWSVMSGGPQEALLLTKLVEAMELQLSYFKSCVLHSICQQIWKTKQWPQDWKRSVFIPIPKKDNAKECSNYHTIAISSHASKFTWSKSFKLDFNHMWTENFQMYKLDLEKAEEPEIKHSLYHSKSRRIPEKHLLLLLLHFYFCFTDYTKSFIHL